MLGRGGAATVVGGTRAGAWAWAARTAWTRGGGGRRGAIEGCVVMDIYWGENGIILGCARICWAGVTGC